MEIAGLRHFSDAECIALLGQSDVARVALSRQALPIIEPVHYHLAGDLLVISAGHPGSAMMSPADGRVVCFEADGPLRDGSTRWVVQVTGVLDPRGDQHVLRLDAAMLSGRVW